ncbi:MAG: hypothetical protein KKD59_04595 [Acidobacteria bacterium]|nr:hypothetical protein [Acidobacteriota bacterium]MBU4494787.1 hypothetical protein [Acidobacteriota bacterium]
MNQSTDINRFFRAAVITASAFLASLFIYLVIVEIIRSRLEPFQGFVEIEGKAGLRYVIYIAAALQVIAIRLLRGYLLRSGQKGDVRQLALKMFRTTILTFALAEIPALLGLVLFLIGGYNRDFYVLLFVSLFLLFMFFPRKQAWTLWIEEQRSVACCL